MGVQVNRNTDFLLQSADQFSGSSWFQQTGHIFNTQNVSTGSFQFFCFFHIVFQSIFITRSIHNVASIAQASFTDFVLFQSFVDGHFHTFQPVQRVEDTEYIDTCFGSFFYERADYIVRIVFVTYSVSTAQQHLEHHIRNFSTQNV